MDEKHVDILDRIEIKLASNINLNFPNFIIHRCDILRNINIRCAIDKIYIWVIYRTPKLIIQYIYIYVFLIAVLATSYIIYGNKQTYSSCFQKAKTYFTGNRKKIKDSVPDQLLKM